MVLFCTPQRSFGHSILKPSAKTPDHNFVDQVLLEYARDSDIFELLSHLYPATTIYPASHFYYKLHHSPEYCIATAILHLNTAFCLLLFFFFFIFFEIQCQPDAVMLHSTITMKYIPPNPEFFQYSPHHCISTPPPSVSPLTSSTKFVSPLTSSTKFVSPLHFYRQIPVNNEFLQANAHKWVLLVPPFINS